MGPPGVVVEAERVELQLELGDRGSWRLLGKNRLRVWWRRSTFAAGLGMVGSRVLDLHTEALQLDLVAAGPRGEDGSLVAEQGGGEAELIHR